MQRAFGVADRLGYTGCDVPLGWWRWLRALETDDPEAPELAAAIPHGLAAVEGAVAHLASGTGCELRAARWRRRRRLRRRPAGPAAGDPGGA